MKHIVVNQVTGERSSADFDLTVVEFCGRYGTRKEGPAVARLLQILADKGMLNVEEIMDIIGFNDHENSCVKLDFKGEC